MAFRYEAIDSAGQTLTDVVEAASAQEAADLLRDRGLFVTRLDEDDPHRHRDASGISSSRQGPKAKFRDVVLFTQQMSMLLRSGARVVEALEAIEHQTQRTGWRDVVRTIHEDVEQGKPLSVALSRFPKLFSGIYVSMVTAGEASGELGLAFDRLGLLTRQQMEIRNRVIGAISYPAVLLVLCAAVMVILLVFVLPRFADMFEVLDVELPLSTSIMISSSRWVQVHWYYVLTALVATGVGTTMFLRSPGGKRSLSCTVVRVPIFGGLIRNIILARMCRIWGQLLQSKVGLLDAVELVQRGTTNHEFHELIGRVARTVTDGNLVGSELKSTWLIPKTYAGAIATGEESGRLTDSLLFVASSLEDENGEALASLTRIIEPLILAGMGLVVGIIAFSLFLPMFDMAGMAG